MMEKNWMEETLQLITIEKCLVLLRLSYLYNQDEVFNITWSGLQISITLH